MFPRVEDAFIKKTDISMKKSTNFHPLFPCGATLNQAYTLNDKLSSVSLRAHSTHPGDAVQPHTKKCLYPTLG